MERAPQPHYLRPARGPANKSNLLIARDTPAFSQPIQAPGHGASFKWVSLIRGAGNQAEHERLRKALLDYCGQDTLALVKVLEKLKLEARGSLQK